jgi:hypothetical protein
MLLPSQHDEDVLVGASSSQSSSGAAQAVGDHGVDGRSDQFHHHSIELGRFINERLVSGFLEPDELL